MKFSSCRRAVSEKAYYIDNLIKWSLRFYLGYYWIWKQLKLNFEN